VTQSTPTNNPGPYQHSPLDRLTPTQRKKRKKPKLNNKKNTKKRHIAKRAGHPECQRGGEGKFLMEL
jgi:hypothetical protein